MIAAHGDCGGDGGDMLAIELAKRLRLAKCFSEVTVGFMRGTPTIEDAAARITSGNVRIYPLFMSDGYYAQKAIPARLGIEGGIDVRGHHVAFERPLGLNPRLPKLLAQAAAEAALSSGMQPAAATLLLVAHGSSNSNQSADAARAIQSSLAATKTFARTDLAFLEQEPEFLATLQSCRRPTIVMGLFTGCGMHAVDDVRAAVNALQGEPIILVEQLGGYAPIIELIASELCNL